MIKKIFIISMILFTYSMSAFAKAQLEFSMVPPKTIQAGKTALMILPVRIMEPNCSYSITTKGTPDYPVMAPEKIEARNESTIEYLPFSVQIPASAPSGQIYIMKVKFIPDSSCQDQNALETELSVKIQQFEDLSIGNTQVQTTTKSPASQFDILLKNTGNTNLNLNLAIENFTPNVRVSLKSTSYVLKPGEFKNAIVSIDFSASGADFASFKVVATSNGQKFLSKNYQIRYLRTTNDDSDTRVLNGQVYFTNDFISEGSSGQSMNTTSTGATISGNLSDYYALSAYVQSLYLQGENESTQYEVTLEKFDNFKIKVGSSLNPMEASVPGVNSLAGVSASKHILENLQVGVYGGLDQNNDTHLGTFSDWNRGYQSRWIVFYDKNASINTNSYGVAGQENIKVGQSISIAPSLVLTQDDLRGTYSKVGASLSAIMAKHAPLQMDVVREEDRYYLSERIDNSINYSVFNLNINVGLSADNITKKSAASDLKNGVYGQAYFKVLFPISKIVQGQATIKYQTAPDGTKGVSPELLIMANDKNWRAFVRVGQQSTSSPQDLFALPGTNFSSTAKNTYVGGNYSYYANEKINLNLSADFYKEERSPSYNYSARAEVEYRVDDNNIFRTGFRSSFDKNTYNSNRQNSIDVSYYHRFDKNWSMETKATMNHHPDLNSKDYGATVSVSWSPDVKVSKKVEDKFGGRSTAELRGKICLDYNENQKCDEGDKALKNIEIRLGALVAVTDENGEYSFKAIQPNLYAFTITKNTVPAEGLSPEDARFDIYANDRLVRNVPLKWIGSVRVIAFEDKNNDGIWQNEKEPQLPNVEISLSGNDVSLNAKTSSVRPVVFTNLKRGLYKIKITKGIPNASPTNKEVNVKLPEQNGGFVYLGLNFDSKSEEEDLGIVVNLEDSIIFEQNLEVNFNIEDPGLKITKITAMCATEVVKITNMKGHSDASFDWKVNLEKCKRISKTNDLIRLKLLIEVSETPLVEAKMYEIIIR